MFTNIISSAFDVVSFFIALSAVAFIFLGIKNIRKAQIMTYKKMSKSSVPAIGEELLIALRQQIKIEQETSTHIPVLKQRRLVGDKVLTQAAADIGVAELEILLRTLGKASGYPPYLVGVNKGGALVANFLAHRLGLHEKQLIKCDYRTDFEKLYCESRSIANGHIVIIDDVVRTGKTIATVKRHFVDTYPNTSVFSVCLVCVYTGEPETPAKPVDYCAWVAKSEKIEMPWSAPGFGISTEASVEQKPIFDDLEIDQIVGQAQQQMVCAG